ncbi:hypothetical protein ACTPEF_24755, partial [Clostridioides difficile]
LYQTESKDIIELGTVHPPYEQNTYIIDFIKNVLKQPEMDRFLRNSYFKKYLIVLLNANNR